MLISDILVLKVLKKKLYIKTQLFETLGIVELARHCVSIYSRQFTKLVAKVGC